MTEQEFGSMKVKDRVALLREKLAADKAWAIRGLIVVYNMQTAQEQDAEQTIEHNKVGFSGVDGDILTSFAKQWLRKHRLSPKQYALLHKRMPHYAVQIEKLTRKGGK